MTPDSRPSRRDVRASGVRTPADGLPYYLPVDAQARWYELLWAAVVALHARYSHKDRPAIPAAWWERARDTETLTALTVDLPRFGGHGVVRRLWPLLQ